MKICRHSLDPRFVAIVVAVLTAVSSGRGSSAPAPAPASAPSASAAAPTVSAHPTFEVKVSGKGQPVVFIPGLACPGEIWNPTLAQFPNIQAHVISIAGFGGLKPSGANPLLPQVRDELIAYLRAAKLPQPPIIVGHSLGGVVGLWIAQTAPDVVGRLVIVDSLPFLPAMMNPAATVESVKPQVAAMAGQSAGQTPEAFAKFQQDVVIPSMVKSPENVARIAGLSGKSDGKTVGQAMSELMLTDLRATIAGVKCPTLVLGAASDRGPREAVQKIFETQYAALPGVRLELIDGARHFIMDDQPEAFAKALRGEIAAAAKK